MKPYEPNFERRIDQNEAEVKAIALQAATLEQQFANLKVLR